MPAAEPKVALGFFSFTEVTDPRAHRAYNEWHQLDHLPEQLPLDGIVSGQRWVLTPACRTAGLLRRRLEPVHYMTLYLMAVPLERTLEAFAALGAELHRLDRFFAERRAHLAGPFHVTDRVAATRVLVSADAVPHRPGRGVFVVVEDGGSSPGLRPARFLEDPGVAGVWTFAPAPELAGTRWHPGEHRISVCFLDADPLEVAERLLPAVTGDAARPDLVLAAPLETVVPWSWNWFDDPAGI